MSEANLPTAIEHGLDGSVLGGTRQLVVDFQVAESQRYASQRVDVGGVEHGDAVGAAEYQTAVGQLARGAVREFIAGQSVGLIERRDASRLDVEAIQALHGTDPEVALVAFLDAGDVGTRQSGNARHLVRLGVVAQQSVADGADPHVAMPVLMHVGGDEHAAANAPLHVGDVGLVELARRRVQAHDVLVEGSDEQLAVVEFLQGGNEGVVDVERLFGLRLAAVGVETEDVGGACGHPYCAVIGLFEVHRHRHGPLPEDAQSLTVVAAFHDAVVGRQPQQAVAVAEDMVDGILRLSDGQSGNLHLLGLLCGGMVDEDAL